MAHPMGLHVWYLTAAMANWRPYLNYITERLTEMVIEPSRTLVYESDGIEIKC